VKERGTLGWGGRTKCVEEEFVPLGALPAEGAPPAPLVFVTHASVRFQVAPQVEALEVSAVHRPHGHLQPRSKPWGFHLEELHPTAS